MDPSSAKMAWMIFVHLPVEGPCSYLSVQGSTVMGNNAFANLVKGFYRFAIIDIGWVQFLRIAAYGIYEGLGRAFRGRFTTATSGAQARMKPVRNVSIISLLIPNEWLRLIERQGASSGVRDRHGLC